jgi:hypothetical protein
MSGPEFFLALVSFVMSAASLTYTIAAYRRLDEEAHETFAMIGADEGNHEARLERLETHAGLKVIPSPSALEETAFSGCINPETEFDDEFAHGREDATLRADETSDVIFDEFAALDAATNEGMAHGN